MFPTFTVHSVNIFSSLRPSRPALRSALAAGLAALAACTDRNPTQPEIAPAPGDVSTTRLECTVQVQAGRMSCGVAGAAGGPSRNLLLGGQGTYVRLASSGTRYDAQTTLLESAVTVQNLLDQQMGTPDGTTVYGVNAVFQSGPTVTDGVGTVTVANADGTGTFTASGQPYFHYPEILEPRGSSQPRTWQFQLPATVNTFVFTVLVETKLAAEQGVLRWNQVRGRSSGFISLYGVSGTSARNVFAVGAAGAIEHFDGQSWAAMPRIAQAHLYGVWAGDTRHVFAVGEGGMVEGYDGNRWTVRESGNSRRLLLSVHGASAETVYAAGWETDATSGLQDRVLLRSVDGGASWTARVTADTVSSGLYAVYGVSATEAYAAGYRENRQLGRTQGLVLHTTDGGATWAEAVLPYDGSRTFRAVWAAGPGEVFVAGYQSNPATGQDEGVVLRSTDGGATWSAATSPYPTGRYIESLWGSSPTDLYAGGEQKDATGTYTGMMLHSTDHGATWQPVSGSFPAFMISVWGSGANDVYTPSSVQLMHYNGSAWSEAAVAGSPEGIMNAVWSGDGTHVVAVGRWLPPEGGYVRGLIARSADGGATWDTTLVAGTVGGVSLRGVWGATQSSLFAVGEDGGRGLMLHSADGGVSWTDVTPPYAYDRQFYAIWGSSATNLVVAGHQLDPVTQHHEALFLRSADGGATWTPSTSPDDARYNRFAYSVWGASPTELYAAGAEFDFTTAGTGGVLYHSTDGGATWTMQPTGEAVSEHMEGVWADAATGAWAVGYRKDPSSGHFVGLVMHSADHGATWTEVHTASAGRNEFTFNGIWGAGSGNVYAVGSFGTISRFDGTRWIDEASGSRDQLLGIFGASARDAWVAGQNGTVLHGVR